MHRGCAIFALTLLVIAAAARAQSTRPASQPAITASSDAQIEQNLTLLTGNNTAEARRIGARGLLAAGTERALTQIFDILRRGEDPAAQLALCRELSEMDSPPSSLIEPILGLLVHPREEVGAAAGLAIGRFPRGEVVPRLEKAALQSGPIGNGQRAALAALGRLGDSPAAIAALVKALDDPNPDIREAALDALERATGIHHASRDDARKWWDAQKGKDTTTWLLDRDARREADRRTQEAHIAELDRRLVDLVRSDYLRRDESEKVARLLAVLSDPEPALRGLGLELTNALITDRRQVLPDVARRVRAMVADPSPDLRRAAIGIIGDLRDPKDAALLLDALRHEPATRVRAALLRAIGRIGDASVLPALVRALDEPSRDVLAEAVTAIGYVGERANGAGRSSRSAAAAALLEGFKRQVRPDPALQVAFLEAMARLSDLRFNPVFARLIQPGRPPEVREAALRCAATRDDPALVDQVAAALSDELPAIRLAAAAALGRCGHGDGHLEALLQRVEGTAESDAAVRAAAWEAFLRVWQTRLLPDRIRWAQRLSAAPDPAAAARRVAVFGPLDRELSQSQSNAALRTSLSEQWADALLVLGQAEQAATLYQSVLGTTPPSAAPGLAAKAVRAAMRAEKFDVAVGLIVRAAADPMPPPASSPRSLMTLAVEEARRLAQQSRRNAALDFVRQARKAVGALLPADWAEELATLQKELAGPAASAAATASAPAGGS